VTKIPLTKIPNLAFVLDENQLETNLELLSRVQQESGCSIILALKSMAMWAAFPQMRRHLVGTTASSLHEARLGSECFGGEVHLFSPAYIDADLDGMLPLASHIVFNSFTQWQRYKGRVQSFPVSCGLRINPEHSESHTALYNPCGVNSRLGITASEFRPDLLDGIEGIHFHALCDQGPDALERVLKQVETKFGEFLPYMKWVNFGGGHVINQPGYDVDKLIQVILAFRRKWDVDVILEPGTGVTYGAGFLVATVLDIIQNGMDIAILNTSASAHMPEVIETPYRPTVTGAGNPGDKPHTYRLGGCTCLSGDVFGDYSFDEPLKVGDKIIFEDQMHYTMVRSTFFNGVAHPAITTLKTNGEVIIHRTFGYEDFKNHLG
jgi:carboxynorspermidine decarboxylase